MVAFDMIQNMRTTILISKARAAKFHNYRCQILHHLLFKKGAIIAFASLHSKFELTKNRLLTSRKVNIKY